MFQGVPGGLATPILGALAARFVGRRLRARSRVRRLAVTGEGPGAAFASASRALPATRDDGGFTIIESVAAAGILLVIAGGVVTTLIATSHWYAEARARTEANAVAHRVMAVILSRNAVADSFVPNGVETTATWPAIVPQTRDETTAMGPFTVETSMSPYVDPATGVLMTRVVVTAQPAWQPLEPAVSVTRFASGWQSLPVGTTAVKVPVHVQCSIQAAGIRVQLLDPVTLSESRYAVTDATGLAVFNDVLERTDGYFLTADYRFGPNIRPRYFPTRILPSHGGTVSNPVLYANKYTLEVVQSAVPALLRVGVFRREGWRFQDGVPVSTPLPFSTIDGLVVYARPTLNIGSADNPVTGIGNQPRFPSSVGMVFSGSTNAYGIACIEIPYTTDPLESQYWTVWCTVQAPGQAAETKVLQCATVVTGGWASGVASISRPEMPSTGAYADIPQWTLLGDASAGPADPSPPQ